MTAVLNDDIPRRVGQLEKKQEDLNTHVAKIDVVVAEIRTDLRWIKWLLMVVAPATFLHLVLAAIQITMK